MMSAGGKNGELARSRSALAECEQVCARLEEEGALRRAEFEAALAMQDEQRRALLAMLEDLEKGRRQIEQARREWEFTLDALKDPVFVHDKDFRVVRVNRAYARAAGLEFKEIIGRLYWEVFPKNTGPLAACRKAIAKAKAAAAAAEEEEEEEVRLDTDRIFLSRSFPVRDPAGVFLYSVHVLEDITERRRAEAALVESEEKFRSISAAAQDAVLMMDNDGRIVFWNAAAERISGYSAQEAMGQELHQLLAPQGYQADARRGFGRFRDTGEGPIVGKTVELVARRKDGSEFPIELSVSALRLRDRWHAVGIVRDISERKRAEHRKRLEEIRLRASAQLNKMLGAEDKVILDYIMEEGITITGSRYSFIGWINEDVSVMTIHAWSKEVMKGCAVEQPPIEFPIDRAGIWAEPLRNRKPLILNEYAGPHPQKHGAPAGHVEIRRYLGVPVFDGERIVLIAAVANKEREYDESDVIALTGLMTDAWRVMQRNRAETAVRKTAAGLKEAQRVARLGNWELDTGTGNVTWSEELYRIFDCDPAQPAPGYEEHPRIMTPESYARMNAAIETTRQTGEPYELDLELIRPDGTRKWITARGEAKRDINGRIVGLHGTALDITGRKQAEQALQRSNRALKALSTCNSALIHAENETALLGAMCRVIVEEGGYRMVWIGAVEHDQAKGVRPVAHAGFEEGYLETLRITWADNERGRGPTGEAIRTDRPQVARNIQTDPNYAPWREQALKRGYASSLALPLTEEDGEVFAVLNIYAAEPEAFDEQETRLLIELAEDLAFGILTLRTRLERNHLQELHLRAVDRLREALTGTIRAVALTVEKRDPYTAGHQNKVADLCVAIGRELGLDENRLEGLRLGATIHDIGKVYIPAEILNRPGKLTGPEFEMIKTHPQVGYDIVKDVQFPWPVGQMILQHHERLDGTGYPGGLKGEAIILEARILAVADVVEAVTAHRPYRPGRGLETALGEIESGRGGRYDPAATDACLRLFRDGRFSFQGGLE